MIQYPGATTEQAKTAVRLYSKAHWTQQDVAEAMNWSVTKCAKVLRLYEKYGLGIFGTV